MKRSILGFVVSFVLAMLLLGVVWATFPGSASPDSLRGATFAQMEQATKDMESYPFVSALDENSQVRSWRTWIDDRSAKSSIFMIGANRMQGKLLILSAAVIGGIFLAFLVRIIAKVVFSKPRAQALSPLLGRLALLLFGAFIVAFLLPVAIANHPMALIFSIPLAIGFGIASTGKDPPPAPSPPILAGVGPFAPPGHGQGGFPQGGFPGGQGGYPQGGQGGFPQGGQGGFSQGGPPHGGWPGQGGS